MRVNRVELRGVFTHADTVVELPERGVVTVGGPNGAGKSAIVEAVAAACFGDTLRGTPPWPDGERASVLADVVGLGGRRLVVERSKTPRGSPKLLLRPQGWELPEHLRTSGGDAVLSEVLGSLSLWRRTHVFRASDAGAFMGSTDGECKRLLESMLGLGLFDAALVVARRDAAALAARHADSLRKSAALSARTEECALRWREARDDLVAAVVGDPPPGADPAEGLPAALDRVRELEEALAAEVAAARSGEERLRSLRYEVAEAGRRLAVLSEGTCSECGQEISADLVEAAAAAHGERSAAAREMAEHHNAESAAHLRVAESINRELAEKRELCAAMREERARWSALRAARARAEERAATAERRVREAAEKLVWLEDQADEESARGAELERGIARSRAVEQVLGLRGVRAQVLGSALSGLEESANAWLARLFPGCTLRLESDDRTKRGDFVERISRRIEGLPHPHGYRACSGGQQRRIDVAALLALSEIAAGAAGVGAGLGTLFFDEALDAIDDEGGLDAAVDVVEELAADRCVVVVSHRAELLSRLNSVLRLRVEGGRVRA